MIHRNSVFTYLQTKLPSSVLAKGIELSRDLPLEVDLPANSELVERRFDLPKGTVRVGEIVSLQDDLSEQNVKTLCILDADYPRGLSSLRNPPPLLHVLGDVRRLETLGFGICGSRQSSASGLSFARKFGALIAEIGVPEVSGYARGVDTEAHFGALQAAGTTMVVLAEGILHFRVKRAFADIEDLRQRMTVVSEFSPHQPWAVGAAMRRNRTIIGLSHALVVVEANSSGGTFNAGSECLKEKKPLFVVQYRMGGVMPPGNSALIAAGATPVTTLSGLRKALLGTLITHEPPSTRQLSLIA